MENYVIGMERGRMFFKKNTRIFMMFLLVFALFASGLQVGTASAASQVKQGTITVLNSDGTPLLAETPVQYGVNENAFDVLVNAVGDPVIVKYTQYSFGKMIDSIYNVAGDTSKYWGFFINGVYSQIGADSYIPQDGDHLTFKLVDPANSTQVSLKVAGENNQTIYDSAPYNIGITGTPTALQLLQVIAGPDKVVLEDTQFGPMITSIDGTVAQGNSYWGFYVNDQYMSVGADAYQLKPNDQVTFKYETYTPNSGTDSGGNSNNSTDSNTNNPLPAKEVIPEEKLQKSIDSSSQFILGNNLDEWSAVALNKAGKIVPSSYLETVSQDIVSRSGKFHFITDPERYILGILAAGGDPTNISGYNLVESIYNGDVTSQGINGVIYALIALDSGNFAVPSSAVWTREKLVNEILQNQQSDGHWSLTTTKDSSDLDITSMALTALAPHKNQAGVQEKIDLGIQYLSKTYMNSNVNSQNIAQIIIALTSLGKYDDSSQLFNKNGLSIMNDLLTFQNNDGGFALNSGESSDVMATQQGLMALAAYRLYTFGPVSAPPETVDAVKQSSNQQGKTLPNTATESANLLLAGFGLILIGLVFVYVNRTRKA